MAIEHTQAGRERRGEAEFRASADRSRAPPLAPRRRKRGSDWRRRLRRSARRRRTEVTPGRSLSVYIRLSADGVHDSASHGSRRSVLRLTRTSGAPVSRSDRQFAVVSVEPVSDPPRGSVASRHASFSGGAGLRRTARLRRLELDARSATRARREPPDEKDRKPDDGRDRERRVHPAGRRGGFGLANFSPCRPMDWPHSLPNLHANFRRCCTDTASSHHRSRRTSPARPRFRPTGWPNPAMAAAVRSRPALVPHQLSASQRVSPQSGRSRRFVARGSPLERRKRSRQRIPHQTGRLRRDVRTAPRAQRHHRSGGALFCTCRGGRSTTASATASCRRFARSADRSAWWCRRSTRTAGPCGPASRSSRAPSRIASRRNRKARPSEGERMESRRTGCGEPSYSSLCLDRWPRSGHRHASLKACANTSRRNHRTPSTSSSTARPTKCASSPRATGCGSRSRLAKAPCCRQSRAASSRSAPRSITCRATSRSRRSCRSPTRRSAPTRCRPVLRACRVSPAPASASRSSTRASGRATARSPAASSLRRISSAIRSRPCEDRKDAYGHGTHIGATIAGSSPYPQDSTEQTPFRGVAPGAHLDQPARHRRGRHRQGQRRHRRDRLGDPAPQALQHPRHQPLARWSGRADLRGRSDVRGRRARRARGHRRRGGGGQPGQRRRGAQRARAHRVSGDRSVRDYGGRAQHEGHGAAIGRRADDLQLEGTDGGGRPASSRISWRRATRSCRPRRWARR